MPYPPTLLAQIAETESEQKAHICGGRTSCHACKRVRKLCAKLREVVEASEHLQETVAVILKDEHMKMCREGKINLEAASQQAAETLNPMPED